MRAGLYALDTQLAQVRDILEKSETLQCDDDSASDQTKALCDALDALDANAIADHAKLSDYEEQVRDTST